MTSEIPKTAERERIIAAALFNNGLTISMPPPARHHTLLNALDDSTVERILPDDQGFLTSAGRFVGRREAARIAVTAEQTLEPKWGAELYSEDLW